MGKQHATIKQTLEIGERLQRALIQNADSSFSYRDANVTDATIAEEFGLQHWHVGTIRKQAFGELSKGRPAAAHPDVVARTVIRELIDVIMDRIEWTETDLDEFRELKGKLI